MKLEKFAEYAKNGNLGKVKQVLESEFATPEHLNARKPGGATALIYACHNAYDEIVDALLSDGRVDVDCLYLQDLPLCCLLRKKALYQ